MKYHFIIFFSLKTRKTQCFEKNQYRVSQRDTGAKLLKIAAVVDKWIDLWHEASIS